MLKLIIISLMFQWYLSGRSTSVHWSKIAADIRLAGNRSTFRTSLDGVHLITQASRSLDGGAIDVIYITAAVVVAAAVMLRVLGPLAQCDILSALNICTA